MQKGIDGGRSIEIHSFILRNNKWMFSEDVCLFQEEEDGGRLGVLRANCYYYLNGDTSPRGQRKVHSDFYRSCQFLQQSRDRVANSIQYPFITL